MCIAVVFAHSKKGQYLFNKKEEVFLFYNLNCHSRNGISIQNRYELGAMQGEQIDINL